MNIRYSTSRWLGRWGMDAFAPAALDWRSYLAAMVGLLWMVLLAALAG